MTTKEPLLCKGNTDDSLPAKSLIGSGTISFGKSDFLFFQMSIPITRNYSKSPFCLNGEAIHHRECRCRNQTYQHAKQATDKRVSDFFLLILEMKAGEEEY